MRIAVCRPQVPFVYGGAELMADTLVSELRAREHEAETVSIPFKWYPGARVLDQAFLGRFSEAPVDRATIRALERLDRVALGEARKVFATSRNVADRLMISAGVEAELLPHPPQQLAFRTAEPERFVLSVNRLDRAKRIDLLIEAAKSDPDLRIVIAG